VVGPHFSAGSTDLLAAPIGHVSGRLRWGRTTVAATCGGIAHEHAGLFRAAAFVDLGVTIAPGTTQVVAYVVSGVGFLGAGAIMKDGGNVRGLNTAATLWCSAAVGAYAGAGKLHEAFFVAALLIAINSVLRPLSRFIDHRSLSVVESNALYRLRLVCETEHEKDAEYQMTRAIALRSLVLRKMIDEKVEDTDNSIIQVVLESPTHDAELLNGMADELRTFPWTQSVEWTETGSEEA